MEEEKIVNEIKSAADKYEIKTTADDIMKKYLNKKNSIDSKIEKHKKKFKWFPFSLGAVSTIAAVVILCLVLPPLNKTKPSQAPSGIGAVTGATGIPTMKPTVPTTPSANAPVGTKSQAAFQVFSSVNIVKNLNSSSSSPLLKKRMVDEPVFKEIASTFDTSYSTVEQLLSTGLNINNKFEEGNFEGKYKNYEYKMTIEVKDAEYIFLSNKSFSFRDTEKEYYGEIVINNEESWKVLINEEKDINSNEHEIEMQIDINDNERITIEQEYEQEEKEYVYTYFKNGSQVYKEEIEVDKGGKKQDECRLVIEKNNSSFVYDKITMSNSEVNSSYKYEDYEGEFCITLDGQNKKFVDKDTNIEVKI